MGEEAADAAHGGEPTVRVRIVADGLLQPQRVFQVLEHLAEPVQAVGRAADVRMEQARRGLAELKKHADSVIAIPNDRVLSNVPRNTPVHEAFSVADDVLLQAVQGISDIITLPGEINVDFADVRAVMKNTGHAVMGIGMAEGRLRALTAAQRAVLEPAPREQPGAAPDCLRDGIARAHGGRRPRGSRSRARHGDRPGGSGEVPPAPEGECWTIVYAGRTIRVRDTVGIATSRSSSGVPLGPPSPGVRGRAAATMCRSAGVRGRRARPSAADPHRQSQHRPVRTRASPP
jgi:hypothetical protein